MPPLVALLSLALCSACAGQAPAPPAPDDGPAESSAGAASVSGYACSIFRYDRQLWLRTFKDGAEQFDVRIGAGGAVAELRDAAHGYAPLLAPSYQGEHTDRVIQQVTWSSPLVDQSVNVPDKRYNVDQAGTFADLFSPVAAVVASRSRCEVVVYAYPRNQWFAALDANLKGKYALRTRYTMGPLGEIRIERVTRLESLTVFGAPRDSFPKLYIEAWTPFARSAFDTLSTRISADGKLGGSRFGPPDYPWLDATQLDGHAILSRSGAAGSPVIGYAFGRQPVACSGCTALHALNFMWFDGGIAVLPGVRVDSPVKVGSVFKESYALLPRWGHGKAFAADLATVTAQVPAPALYAPGEAMDATTAAAVAELAARASAPRQRVETLGDLVVFQ